jgi:hypothetical protein
MIRSLPVAQVHAHINEPFGHGITDQIRNVMHPERLQDVLPMFLHRSDTDAQARRDFPIRESLAEQGQHLEFAAG